MKKIISIALLLVFPYSVFAAPITAFDLLDSPENHIQMNLEADSLFADVDRVATPLTLEFYKLSTQ
ncbi:MAG: hypothetical protein LBG43_02005 [Treponema sp.]|jgi:hypothetical protein|nr:hypothetical protein [Treponema sp.]